MKTSKLALSAAEWQLASTTDFILTKNRVIEEVYDLFGQLADSYRQSVVPIEVRYPGISKPEPKIARGEKYEEMPWVMLDFPRIFSAETGHFAIRSFFWWGHFFSIQLQASGSYFQQLAPAFDLLEAAGWATGKTLDAWDHQLPNNQWLPLETTAHKAVLTGDWVAKAAKKMPIDQWAFAYTFFNESYNQLVKAIAAAH